MKLTKKDDIFKVIEAMTLGLTPQKATYKDNLPLLDELILKQKRYKTQLRTRGVSEKQIYEKHLIDYVTVMQPPATDFGDKLLDALFISHPKEGQIYLGVKYLSNHVKRALTFADHYLDEAEMHVSNKENYFAYLSKAAEMMHMADSYIKKLGVYLHTDVNRGDIYPKVNDKAMRHWFNICGMRYQDILENPERVEKRMSDANGTELDFLIERLEVAMKLDDKVAISYFNQKVSDLCPEDVLPS